MWLQARFTADDLSRALSLITPARVPLDKDDHPDRTLWVSKPERLRLLESGLIVIDARAQICWDVLGLQVPVTLQKVSLSLAPSVIDQDGQQVIAFAVQLEEADLSAVPAFVEKSLLVRVNEGLRESGQKLVWRFLETLDFKFTLPVIEPRREVSLYARWGHAEVTAEGLTMTVGWGLDTQVARGAEAPTPPPAVQSPNAEEGEPVGGPRARLPDLRAQPPGAQARR